ASVESWRPSGWWLIGALFAAPLPGVPRRPLNPPSLDVLDLFLDAVDRPLHLDDRPRNLRVGGLAGDGVRLAQHLLRQEIQRPPHGPAPARRDQFAELLDVPREPADLLRNVGPLRVHRDLADHLD